MIFNSILYTMSQFSMNFSDAVRISEDPEQGVLRTRGENNHPSLTIKGQGYTPLAYFEKLIRDLEEERHDEFINTICHEAKYDGTPEKIVDLFLTMFQTRDCRGGKGDRLPFIRMMKLIYAKYPTTIISLVECIPFYGYWKDILLIISDIHDFPVAGIDYKPLVSKLYSLMATQLIEDNIKLQNGSKELSFAGKYAPRESHSFCKKFNAVDELCKRMYPEIVGDHLRGKDKKIITSAWNKAKSMYRMLAKNLTAALNVPEVLMCANEWAKINFELVTSVCLSRNTKCFLNLNKDGSVRHPQSEDRIQCALNLANDSCSSKLNGKMLFPHELVHKIINNRISDIEELVINAQWIKIRENVVEMAQQMANEQNESNSDFTMTLADILPMCDVSGSMNGVPMEVSIALSILLSEIHDDAFGDLILSFSTDPKWEDLKKCTNIVQKVKQMQRSDWGGSTDFYKAMERIASIVKEKKISVEKTPDLVVFSDMQFNEANRDNWDTMYERIVKLFHTLGMELDGEPRPAPKIVFWNLRSNTLDYPVAANQNGVVTMSGYSPALMKFFLSGQLMGTEVEEIDAETGEIKTVMKQITPFDSFKAVLADSRLDMIRAKLHLSEEGILSEYSLD